MPSVFRRREQPSWQELTDRTLALIGRVSDRLPTDRREQAEEYAANVEWELALDHLRGLPLNAEESEEFAALEEDLRRVSPGLRHYLLGIVLWLVWRVERGRWLRRPLPIPDDSPPLPRRSEKK